MSKKLNKACVCGHFAFGKTYLNGQTIKTKIVSREIQKIFGEKEVLEIDTHDGMKKIVLLPFILMNYLRKCENMIILPAQNGLRIIAPILVVENLLFNRKLHYVVVGGWLPEFLENKPVLTKILKRFDYIYVEAEMMKRALEKKGFINVLVMPNCKELTVLNEDEIVYSKSEPYKLCTFSRVMKEKGIEDAFLAVKMINEQYGKIIYILDIYGQVDGNQIEWFESLKKEFPSYIKYKGSVPFYKSVETLKDYFALLFPTYYKGEGFAGTLIDAMASGTPVIASDWKYNEEFVKESFTGMIYPTRNQAALIECLVFAFQNSESMNRMRCNCLKEARKFQPEETIKILIANMESDKL